MPRLEKIRKEIKRYNLDSAEKIKVVQFVLTNPELVIPMHFNSGTELMIWNGEDDLAGLTLRYMRSGVRRGQTEPDRFVTTGGLGLELVGRHGLRGVLTELVLGQICAKSPTGDEAGFESGTRARLQLVVGQNFAVE